MFKVKGIQKQIFVILTFTGLLGSGIFGAFIHQTIKTRTLKEINERADTQMERTVQMLMVSTIRFQTEFAGSDEFKKTIILEDWKRTIRAIDNAIIHDFGVDKDRVRLIGDKEITGVPTHGGNMTAVEAPYERDFLLAFKTQKLSEVRKEDEGHLRLSKPLYSSTHPGCANCHGINPSENVFMGSLNVYIPLKSPLEKAQNETIVTVGFLILMLCVLIGIIGFYISKNLVKPIKELDVIATKVSTGNTNVKFGYYANNELGSLAESFKTLTENFREKSLIADKIAEGNLSVKIQPLSPEDLLAHSMEKVS